jgi:hypothetical protein
VQATTQRTLVKSAPELWELVDDAELQGRWCATLLGRDERLPIRVTLRDAGVRIAWRSADPGLPAQFDLSLDERGFGTNVAISAFSPLLNSVGRIAGLQQRIEGESVLAGLLDELSSVQRQPFSRT